MVSVKICGGSLPFVSDSRKNIAWLGGTPFILNGEGVLGE